MLNFRRQTLVVLTIVALASFSSAFAQSDSDSIGPFRGNAAWTSADGGWSIAAASPDATLMTGNALADSVTSLEFKAPKGARASIFLMGRYSFEMLGNGDWQTLSVRFRAPRFNEGFQKTDNALAVEVRTGADVKRNVIVEKPNVGARWDAEDMRGPMMLVVTEGPFAIRNIQQDAADYSRLTLPKTSGGETNAGSLKDFVALGKESFEAVGCMACHLVEPSDTAVSSGPNLFGLFRPEPRAREIVEGGEEHRFQIKAGREYLRHSIRAPADQIAVAESGAKKGEAFLPIMPAFAKEVLSDQQIDAIGDYLATLNPPGQRGPVVKLAGLEPEAPYDPLADRLQWLVNDEVRMQRGPLPGVSARSIHVGNPNGVNYSFDPRNLAVSKIWQGGFLDMTGELTNRGGKGLALGYDSREISFGDHDYLLAPLNAKGALIDFSFKDAKWGDLATMQASLYSKEDQLPRIAVVDAQFMGYTRNSKDKTAAPVFKYRVGKNVLEVATAISDRGAVVVSINGDLKTPQSFALNSLLLKGAAVSVGKIENDRWTLPAGKVAATLRATAGVAGSAWHPAPSNYAYKRSALVKTPATAKLPAGYSIESYYPPKDNYGRDQLFEALGLGLAKDGTLVVATRTAGIWRLVGGEWRMFAEGLFDSLGVVVEDDKGLVVVAGQKAELTRISDTNGDGVADKYETLFDAHSFHGNYHSYMHGPVRGPDGAYYFALNLAHGPSNEFYTAGGNVMGTWGGFNGWAFRVEPNGKFQAFANGMRSPASLGVAPDGRVWYTDNQGDFVGTSKMFELKKDAFYGHPAGLVDLPGMTPDSPEIQWDKVWPRKAQPVIMFPHNRVANSPGNPAWITQKNFGPFAGQLVIGDQTQSNLLRVAMQKVGEVEQGSVMPFLDGLESGVMRPVFLPDGSLLLGQTGRGWQAKGGKIASLQHVRWGGKTIAPAIVSMTATTTGFRLDFTQPLGNGVSPEILKSALSLETWVYRDAPNYGSDELDLHPEGITGLSVSADRKSVSITLASLEQKKVHPQQTPRIYHARLASGTLFDANAPAQLDAYYTLRVFPTKQ